MAIELRLPNITGETPEAQLAQIKSFLYSTIEQLNYALTVTEKETTTLTKKVEKAVDASSREKKAESTFNDIKNLIIKNADIVEAYREELQREYNGIYVAKSEMGTYEENIRSSITEGPEGINVRIDSVQSIANEVNNAVKDTEGYIKIGIIGKKDTGDDLIGIKIGQNLTDSNRKVFAQYTAEGTTLYNPSGQTTVEITDGKTKLTGTLAIEGSAPCLFIGGYSLMPLNGLGLFWEGE